MLQPWIDCETTGLDENTHLLLEVGIVVTDGLLGECEEVANFAIGAAYPPGVLEAAPMTDFVRGMHERSRLWNWLRKPENTVPVEQLDDYLCTLGALWAQPNPHDNPPLANFNAPFDRRWLARYAPKFVATCLHYRCFDVSTLRATVQAVYPEGYGPTGGADVHRAVPDARDAVKYWRWYRAHVMNPQGRSRSEL